MNGKRIGEIDYLKCVCILLMIAFHLVFFSEKYPLAKQWVYTFHMPVFLILSGYLMQIEKRPSEFLRAMAWIFVPYMVMETGYVAMSAVLPVRDKVDCLSVGLMLEKLFLHPMGPYWYLHTYLLCGLIYYGVFHWAEKMRLVSRLVVLGTGYAVLADACQLVSLPNALYFLAIFFLSFCMGIDPFGVAECRYGESESFHFGGCCHCVPCGECTLEPLYGYTCWYQACFRLCREAYAGIVGLLSCVYYAFERIGTIVYVRRNRFLFSFRGDDINGDRLIWYSLVY